MYDSLMNAKMTKDMNRKETILQVEVIFHHNGFYQTTTPQK